MLSNFRTASAAFLIDYSVVEIYFTAQHFGMPTRLLDWSTNPLAALFFACANNPDEDGFVHMMDAATIVPEDAIQGQEQRLYRSVMSMRHPFFVKCVEQSFWADGPKDCGRYILPVRPDLKPGRIAQQSSCFTFHMFGADDFGNDTLKTLQIAKDDKPTIRKDLERLNVNQFTAYYDLDHLSKEIRRVWGL